MRKVVTADEAVSQIPDGATVLVVPMPCEEVFPAFARLYEKTGHPRDLTVVWAAGLGPFSEERRGMNHFAYPGMVKRVIAGHVGLNYLLVKAIANNELEAYSLPQGTMTQLYREMAAGRPGLVTRVGLGTFVDPRIEGGKMNERTRQCEDLVEVVQIGDKEALLYKAFRVQAGIIRGTTADPLGNITTEDEGLTMEVLEAAMAVKNHGGVVIAQVLQLSDTPARPRDVTVPYVFVDCVVVAQSRKTHPHTLFVDYDPAYISETRAPLEEIVQPLPLNLEKVICRRGALELRQGMTVNLGVGVPMGVAAVAFEEGVLEEITFNNEIGAFGGLPEGGKNFGPVKNPSAFISQAHMFDFYDGGGLDITYVGMAQVDQEGNVNVSKLRGRPIGPGGFINITQAAKKCVFCGEFTAAGLDAVAGDGRLVIREEGRVKKFVKAVEQITFNGKMAREEQRPVLYVTERCVFRLVPEGLLLEEAAPGIDIQRDIVDQMEFKPIVPDTVRPMPEALFQEPPIGLAARTDAAGAGAATR